MKLTGPIPAEHPVFPTPWTVRDSFVTDAGGNHIFAVSGDLSTGSEDRALAEYIVNLVNADNNVPTPDEAKLEKQPEFLDIITNYRNVVTERAAFEVEPGSFLHGTDGTRTGAEDRYLQNNNYGWTLEEDFFPVKVLNGPNAGNVYYTKAAWDNR